MAQSNQEIRDVVAYSQRPIVTEQAIESAAPRSVSVEKTTTASGKPRYEFEEKASE